MLTSRERVAALLNEMSAILDGAKAAGRALTDDDTATYDAKQAEVESLNAQIAREEKLEALKAAAATAKPAVMAPAAAPAAAPGPEARKEFENIAEFFHAVRFNNDDQRLASLYNDGDSVRGEQRMDTGSTGGFAIPKQFLPRLLEVTPQDAIIRPRATVIPTGTPPDAAVSLPALDQTGAKANANMYGGVEVYKTAEGGQKGETAFRMREIELRPEEVSAYMELTDKLLRNWPAASAFVQRQFQMARRGYDDYEFLRGNGVGGALGILNSGARYQKARNTAGTVDYNDLVHMVSRLLRVGGQATWVACRAMEPVLRQLRNLTGASPETGDGSLIWQDSAVPGQPDTLLGRPILFNERSPGLGTEGDLILMDAQGYLIKDGSGPFVATSEHVKFRNNITAMKIFWNTDGQPWLTAPIKGEDDYETSPFVTLADAA